MAKTRCAICGKVLPDSTKLVEHIKRRHSRLSRNSIRYLKSIGVSDEKLKKLAEIHKLHDR